MIEEKTRSRRKSNTSKSQELSKEKTPLLIFQKEFSNLFQAITDCLNFFFFFALNLIMKINF